MLIPLLGIVLATLGLPRPPAAWADTTAAVVSPEPPAARLVGLDRNGDLEAFVRSPDDGTVWHAGQQQPGTNWSDWTSLGGASDTDPVVATNSDGRLEVFLLKNGVLTSQAQAGNGSWGTTWTQPHPGHLDSEVSVAANLDGSLQVFGVAAGGLWTIAQTVPGSVQGENWDPWTTAGAPGPGVSLVGRPAVALNANGQLQVFVRGSDTEIWGATETSANAKESWSAWTPMFGSTQGDPAVARNQDGRLQVFATGMDGNVWYDTQTSDGTGWTGWGELAGGGTPFGTMAGDPTVATNADGRLEVFAHLSDGTVWHTKQTQPGSTTSWSVMSALGTAGGDPTAVANQDGRLEFFDLQSDNTLGHRAQNEPGAPPPPTDDWAAWDNLGYGFDPCRGTGTPTCLSILNAGDGTALAPANTTDASPWVVSAPAQSGTAAQQWTMVRDSSGSGLFQLKNKAMNNLCLDTAFDLGQGAWRTNLVTCNSQDVGQQWYVEPGSTPGTYQMKQLSGNDGLVATSQDPGTGVDTIVMGDSAQSFGGYNVWKPGTSSGVMTGMAQFAAQYGLTLCAKDNSTCSFSVDKSLPTAYIEGRTCLKGTLYYNATNSVQTPFASITDTTGWENTVGGSLTLGGSVGTGPEAAISFQVSSSVTASYSHSFIGTQAIQYSSYLTLQPGQYGWLETGTVTKKVTGTWSFDKNRVAWTTLGQSSVHALDGTDNAGSTVKIVETSTNPPSNC
ncbi:hypothetical protein OG455_38240 [Kitasatospora sp. NBC_01287]|uniref:hypothetical protein n=1 Tax=Kitasatospora sp. NBC_01287 TaxID=2903573 RepID=UPI00224FD38D|nr:hypothetical protein [Kitasatospora sp. NBC_01287]MCX4751277.1 hypothetical protein [Kitasatospora sp. NBC_01287]